MEAIQASRRAANPDEGPSATAGGDAPAAQAQVYAPGLPWRVRLRRELLHARPLLNVLEPSLVPGAPAVAADLVRCLAPRRVASLCCGRCAVNVVPLFRAAFLGAALHATYVDFAVYYPPQNWWYYMIYLTHWGHVLNTSYLACSLACCLLLPRWENGASASAASRPPLLARATWALYAVAAPLSIAVALLYWSALVPIAGGVPKNGPTLYHLHFGPTVERYTGWDGPPLDFHASTYVSIMEHGVVGSLVLLDGSRLGSVPVRAGQVLPLLALCVTYLAWSGLHCLLGVGLGEWAGPMWETDDDGSGSNDDDAIYPVLNWCGGKDGIEVASYVSTFAVLVLAPTAFWVVWMLGLAAPREEEEERKWCGRRWKHDGSRRPAVVAAGEEEEAFGYQMHGGELA